ncbi:hypothetical protein GCM10010339_59200 [Streptomyces alanosinicus]|uniref:Transcriptional regulator LacI/GalR-like sensor domain-containing protein n=1 Tax=Streptomyces alanosinicus TaxID=68171 RepID=A0A918YPI5_9ACTN|nr:hypothetical protein GCM10010339_59200 [Streptomyces alanosinicus]
MVKTQLTREHGYTAAVELLSLTDRPTAVFTANDMQALGAYQTARELGLRVPHDLSVVGLEIATTLTVRESTAPPQRGEAGPELGVCPGCPEERATRASGRSVRTSCQ